MEYIWIVILIIAYIIWAIISIKDIIDTVSYFKLSSVFDNLEEYTLTFIILHIVALFVYSLCKFIALKNQ